MTGKRKNSKALSQIFDESQLIKLSESDLNKELIAIGIDPETLVSEGLEGIRKAFGSLSDNQILGYMPLAAGKSNAPSIDLLKSIKPFKKGSKKKVKK
jgi:hypothetical protein